MKIGLVYSNILRDYDFGPGHPFRGDRFESFITYFQETLYKSGGFDLVMRDEPASDEDLLLWHRKDYIEAIGNAASGKHVLDLWRFISGDNVNPLTKTFPQGIDQAARVIVKNSMTACELVQEEKYEKVISLGGGLHHAKPGYGEGFCVYNDVVIAAKHLIRKYGLERILIIDTDAHAGNGTCEAFYQDPRVLLIDIHQKHIYPGTGYEGDIGEKEGEGFTVNVPLPPFADDESYKLVFEEIVHPLAEEFNPQFIIRNGGSDPHSADRITQLRLALKGFQYIGQRVREIAQICDGKEVDLICSGYKPDVLPRAWSAIISGLANVEVQLNEPLPIETGKERTLEQTRNMIRKVKRNLEPYWKQLAEKRPNTSCT